MYRGRGCGGCTRNWFDGPGTLRQGCRETSGRCLRAMTRHCIDFGVGPLTHSRLLDEKQTALLFRRVIALPRTILIPRLPIKLSSSKTTPSFRWRSPYYMDHCWSLWWGSKRGTRFSSLPVCVFISERSASFGTRLISHGLMTRRNSCSPESSTSETRGGADARHIRMMDEPNNGNRDSSWDISHVFLCASFFVSKQRNNTSALRDRA